MQQVLYRAHRLVAIQRLQVIRGIEASHLADVAAHSVALSDGPAVDLEDWHAVETQAFTHTHEVLKADARILEVDAGRVECDSDRRGSSVHIEIGEFVVRHSCPLRSENYAYD